MAEEGKRSFTASFYRGSDEVFDVTCTPCIREGNYVEAVNFCTVCVEFFCPSCSRYHKKLGATSGHDVVSTDQADKTTERCQEHPGELIYFYCAEHAVVGCSICLALDHRACKGGAYIPTIAGGPEKLKDRQRIKDEISQALNAMHQVKISIHGRQVTADLERNEHSKHIKHYTKKLIEHANDVDDNHKKITNGLKSEMKNVDDVMEKLKTRLRNLNNSQVTNDSQVFVDMKLGEMEVQDANRFEKCLSTTGLGQSNASFAFEDYVNIVPKSGSSLGKVAGTKPYKAVLSGQYKVESEEDTFKCNIADTCVLSHGQILMVDCTNNCIKLLDTSNKVITSFRMPFQPCGICLISYDEVAVTSTLKRTVQFVHITGRWKLSRSFKVEDGCRGITHSNDQLLVSCGGHLGVGEIDYHPEGPGFVGIYDMSGTIIRKIQFDPHGRQIFSVPRHITTTANGGMIHIADEKWGVITVDRSGIVLSRFSRNLQTTTGVCAVSEDSLIVCGVESNNILEIDASGNLVAELLSSKDGIDGPVSVSYVLDRSRLVVTFWESKMVKIFDLML